MWRRSAAWVRLRRRPRPWTARRRPWPLQRQRSRRSSVGSWPKVRGPDVRVILAILSVLAGWSLLGALAAGLLLILKPLERVRASLRKITMGVRAIEQETAPLGGGAETLIGSLGAAADTLGSATQHLADINADLDHVAHVLRARTGHEGGAHA